MVTFTWQVQVTRSNPVIAVCGTCWLAVLLFVIPGTKFHQGPSLVQLLQALELSPSSEAQLGLGIDLAVSQWGRED